MHTLADIIKPKKAKPAKRTQPQARRVRRIVQRMISAYMSYVKDNPGGTP